MVKSTMNALTLSGREHTYWILDLEAKVYSIWVLWTIGFQECKGQVGLKVKRVKQHFFSWFKSLSNFC